MQEKADDASGEMRPARDVRAIEQRLRQWSDGRQSVHQLLLRPMRAAHRLVPLHIELPWSHSKLHSAQVDDPENSPLFEIVISAMTAPGPSTPGPDPETDSH